MRKILSKIIATAMLVTMFSTATMGTAFGATELSVSVDSVNGNKGEQIVVPVKFEGVSDKGISTADMTITYDAEKLEYVSVGAGSIVSNPSTNFASNKEKDGSIKVLFLDYTMSTGYISTDGAFANLTFNVLSSSAESTKVDITSSTFGDKELDTIKANVSGATIVLNGGVPTTVPTAVPTVTVAPPAAITAAPTVAPITAAPTVAPTASTNGFTVNVDSVKANNGDQIEVPINFINVPSKGISTAGMTISYDATKLEYISSEAGSLIKNPTTDFAINNSAAGTLKVLFLDYTMSTGFISADGVFAKLVFKVISSESSDSTITLSDATFADKDLVVVLPEINNGKVSIGTTVTEQPTIAPTATPTVVPTVEPTVVPTVKPTVAPTATPTVKPTVAPTATPTVVPTVKPTVAPTATPTVVPTVKPTVAPTVKPTVAPTATPTIVPTVKPTVAPTATPTAVGFSVSIGSVMADKGDVITVPVYLLNVPASGISTADMKIDYDTSKLQYVSGEAGSIVTDPTVNFAINNDTSKGKISALFLDYTMTDGYISENGVFINLTFKVLDTASGSTTIKVSSATFGDTNLDTLVANMTAGTITIIGDVATEQPTATPTAVPTATPTVVPTATPTIVPTAIPTVVPTATPTIVPTATPTVAPTATTVPTTTPTGDYSVSYTQYSWGTGATVCMIIKNNSTKAMNGWNVEFTFDGNQKIVNAWNCEFTQSGNSVKLTNVGYNGLVPAGDSVTIGFNISYSGTNEAPTKFAVSAVEEQKQTSNAPATPKATTAPSATAGPKAPAAPNTKPADPKQQTATKDCSVNYSQVPSGVGATVSLTIKNNGTSPVKGWTVSFSYAGDQKIVNAWNCAFTQTGSSVKITNLKPNESIPAGGSVTVGFNITSNGENKVPTEFTVEAGK